LLPKGHIREISNPVSGATIVIERQYRKNGMGKHKKERLLVWHGCSAGYQAVAKLVRFSIFFDYLELTGQILYTLAYGFWLLGSCYHSN